MDGSFKGSSKNGTSLSTETGGAVTPSVETNTDEPTATTSMGTDLESSVATVSTSAGSICFVNSNFLRIMASSFLGMAFVGFFI